VINQAALHRGI